jgi:phenylpropionate dioxygenase-like ring-hydroxylating dioxygenase large terminal subunit
MTTQEQNALLTQTGPGTAMGELFRRYWIPALLADELPEPDCPPVRVRLLSERLIAIRDSQGRVGLMDEFCAHRGVSLWFGRNEENGLRCPYHGWKYDVTGQCVDVPSEPEASGYCRKIKLKSYPCIELGGVIWAFMGPPASAPPKPAFEWVGLPPAHVYVSKRWQECTIFRPWRAASIQATSRSCTAMTSTATRSIATPAARSSPVAPTLCSILSSPRAVS